MRQTTEKGEFSYLQMRRKKTSINTILCFVMVLIVFFTGLITTRTRNNLLTVVAILGVLPASKAAVGMIMHLRVKPMNKDFHQKCQPFENKMTILYHMLISSKERVVFAECLAIYEHSLFLLCKNPKINEKELCAYLKKTLANQGKGNASVKLFREEGPFIERLKSVQNVSKKDNAAETEQKIKEVLCAISM